MIGLLFQLIFLSISKVFSILVSPLFLAITALFPDLANVGNYIASYLEYGVTYLCFARDIALVPIGALSMLFSYFLIKYSIYLITLSVRFVTNVYNFLKP